jgi:hypothetical protein
MGCKDLATNSADGFLPIRAKGGVLLAGFGQRLGIARLSTVDFTVRALSDLACDLTR